MDAVKNNRCPSFLPQLCGFLHYPERIQQWITFLSSYEESHPWGTALLVPGMNSSAHSKEARPSREGNALSPGALLGVPALPLPRASLSTGTFCREGNVLYCTVQYDRHMWH